MSEENAEIVREAIESLTRWYVHHHAFARVAG
jgi:hypothetical protein